MTTPENSWLARRQLRAPLRKARETQELTQLQASGALDWSLSKIVRIEAGSVGVSTTDLLALLRLYKVTDETETGKLVELARASRHRPWYHPYQDVISSGFEHYLNYEAAAATILAFHPLTIPGLLQTEDYARAILEANCPSGLELRLDRRLDLRRQRQERLERQGWPRLRYILDEAALHRVVGGPRVMVEQLTRLRDAMDQPEVSVGIVPFTAGAHSSMTGPFTVVEFEDPEEDDALYLEVAPQSYTNREDKDVVTDYRARFDLLSSAALPAEQATELIETLTEDLRGAARAREPR
jgi:transcriptional regulator with XRE-family HTH domain